MLGKNRSFLCLGGLCSLAICAGTGWAAIPLVINHQGVVQAGDVPFTGGGAFRFAFVDAGSGNNVWTNDGSSIGTGDMPQNALTLNVDRGLYSVLLGDVSVQGMTAISSSVFDADAVLLRIWFDDGTHGAEQLSPDQPVTSGAYAIKALHAENAAEADHALDADRLGGQTPESFAATAHDHALESLPGAVTDAQVPDDITVNHAATADLATEANTLNGYQAKDFMPINTDDWVDETGDTIDGNLLVNGLLGINYSRPVYPLEVNGNARVFNNLFVMDNVEADNFVFNDAQTRWMSIASPAFVRATPTMACYIGNGYLSGTTDGAPITVLAPVSLPHGANITGYKVRCKDSDTTQNLTVKMITQTASGASVVVNSTLTTSGSGGMTTLSSTTLDVLVDNENYAYLVQVEWTTPTTPGNIALYHVHVQYTVPDARP